MVIYNLGTLKSGDETMPKKANESGINFPENICSLADKFRESRLEKEKKEKEEKLKREQERRRIQDERLKDGLSYAKKVFAWATAFRKSRVGKELMRVSHIPTAYSNIFFFDGRIEGTNWVGFLVDPKGIQLNHGGRYSTLTQKAIKSPLHLAKSVDTKILVAACEWIDTGKVWECIERRFDYLEEKQPI